MNAHDVLGWLQNLLGGPFVFVLAGVRHQHGPTVVVVHVGDRIELSTDPETARELVAALEQQQVAVNEADGRIRVDVS